jgi:hypothetical protein
MHSPEVVERLAKGLPGYTRLATFGAALPFYECTLEIRLLRRQDLSTVEQICLECVVHRFDSTQEIEAILGLSQAMVADAIGNLIEADLIDPLWDGESDARFRLTDRGSTALADQCYFEPETVRFRVLFDALKGELTPTGALQYINEVDVEQSGLHSLPARMYAPDVGDLSAQELATVIKETQKNEPGRVPEGDLYDIVAVERSSRTYLPCVIIAFAAEDQSGVALRVLERETRRTDYEEILEAMLARDREVLPLQARVDEVPIPVPVSEWIEEATRRENEAADAARRLADTRVEVARVTASQPVGDTQTRSTREQLTALEARLQELQAELEEKMLQIRSVRRIDTSEHRPLLERAFKEARRRVIIMSPWLNRMAVTDPLIEKMRAALRRGVHIVIGWGYPESKDSDKHQRSERTLRHLRNLASDRALKGKLDLVEHGNTHKKVLIVDDQYMVVTSFNWLSYRGDPELGIRDEVGVYMELPDVIRDTATDFMGRLQISENSPQLPKRRSPSAAGQDSKRARESSPRQPEDPAAAFERAGWRVAKRDGKDIKYRK